MYYDYDNHGYEHDSDELDELNMYSCLQASGNNEDYFRNYKTDKIDYQSESYINWKKSFDISQFILVGYNKEQIDEIMDMNFFNSEINQGVHVGCDCGCGGDYFDYDYAEKVSGYIEKYKEDLITRYRLYHILNNTEQGKNYIIINKDQDYWSKSKEREVYDCFTQEENGYSDFIKKAEEKYGKVR